MTRPTSLPVPVLLRKRHLASVIMHEWPRAEEWRTWQKAQQLSTRTIDARIFRVYELAAFTDNPPAEATTEQIVRYMASVSARAGYREDKVRPATMATYHSHLRAWFAWLVKMEYRDDDPMMRVPTPRRGRSRPRPVTDREMLAVFAVGVHKRTRMMLLLAAFQGLRVHEIAKIRGEHVNLLDNQLRVIGKGNHDATLPLHPLVASFAVTFPRTGYWFPTNATGQAAANGSVVPVQARSVSGIISDVFNRAGVDGGAHRLRHWYATTLLKGGANTRLVQTLMRHGSIQSTEIYTEIAEVDQAAALSRLGMPAAQDEQQSA
jgi:site-specific recombinase XerD